MPRERIPAVNIWTTRGLLFRPRLGRNQPRYTVIDDQLPVMLAGVLNKSPGKIAEPGLLLAERIHQQIAQSAVAFALDQCGSVTKGLLHEIDHCGLGAVVGGLGIAALRWFDPLHRIDEVVIG